MFGLTTLHRLRALVVAVLLLSPSAALAQDQRAVLELVVNEVSSGEALVVLRGSDVLVSVAALSRAGLRGFEGDREEIAGQQIVSLTSLAPAIAFRLDERELRLSLTANPELLGEQVRDLYQGAPANLVYKADTSGFLNYSVNYASNGHVDLLGESAVSLGGALVYNTFTATRQSTLRGLTNLTLDDRQGMRRWTFGDSLAYTGPLGGDSWIGGFSVAKEFSINPYFVRHPTLSLSTPIAVPSVMEVQVNGQVVSREQVAPGRLEVRNLPMTLGRNDAQIVVRDAFGNERELSRNYYLATTALARGVHEYQYSVGFARQALGSKSWNYGAPVALARHRVGLSNSVTVGGRVELHPGQVASGGPSVNLRLPVGEVEAASSVSRHGGEWGGASLVGFSYTRRPVGAGGSVLVSSRHYATLSPSLEGQDVAVQANVFASASLGGPLSVTVQHARSKLHQGLSRSRSAILSTIQLSQRIALTASASYARDERGRSREAFAGLTFIFGDRGSATIAQVRDIRGSRVSFDAQRSLPAGEGYGYQVHAEDGNTQTTTGVARYQGRHGRYEIRQESVDGRSNSTISAMGSIVGIGGRLFASRPVQDSFALVRVPGVSGVRAFSSHQSVGKTGRTGDLLVPALQAYYGNILGVADSDIPFTYAVSDVARTLALPYRGGAVALFGVRRLQRVVGFVTIGDGARDTVPAYGDFTVTTAAGDVASPVGANGAFYFEDLPPGVHPAVLRDSGGRECAFAISVPTSEGEVVTMGTLRCEIGHP